MNFISAECLPLRSLINMRWQFNEIMSQCIVMVAYEPTYSKVLSGSKFNLAGKSPTCKIFIFCWQNPIYSLQWLCAVYLVPIIVFNAIHWLFMCCKSLQLFHLGYISGKNIFCPHYWMKFNRVDELRTNASLSQRLASPRTVVSNGKYPPKIIFKNSLNWLITLIPTTVWHSLNTYAVRFMTGNGDFKSTETCLKNFLADFINLKPQCLVVPGNGCSEVSGGRSRFK